MSATEDHDSPWKEALELFFQPFLQLLYPDIHEAVDWTQPFTFLDKELQKLVPSGYTGRRHADKLVQVWFRDKKSRWLLIHIEVQGRSDATFPERMFTYYHRIREHHGKEVISLAVLTDINPHYRPDRFEEVIAGSGVTFHFRTVKLLDWQNQMDVLLASDNPFALLVAAQLTARLVKDGKQRADNLIGFYRLVARRQMDRSLIARLPVFLEWLVALPREIEEGYYAAKIEQMKEEQVMPYVSTWERKAIKKGIEEGIQQGIQIGADQGRLEGRAAVLSRQLQLKFGDLSDALRQRLVQAGETELDMWAERILFVDSIEKVFE